MILQFHRLIVYSTSPDHRPFVHIVADTSSVSADKAQCATLLLAFAEKTNNSGQRLHILIISSLLRVATGGVRCWCVDH